MNLETVNINDLNPSTYNPRKDLKPSDEEYQKIKRSIQEFGYVEPIIINSDNTIIGGHQRYKVLKQLGYADVECIKVDLDKTKEKALNLALNKIDGAWDEAKLKDVLKELDDLEYDIEFTGFTDDEFSDMLKKFDSTNDNDGEDGFNVEEAIEEAENEEQRTKKGDIYKLGKHLLMCADCRKVDNISKLIGENDIGDMFVFTDPPYGIDVVPNRGSIGSKGNTYQKIKGDKTILTAKVAYNNCLNLGIEDYIIFGGNYFLSFLPLSKSNSSSNFLVWDKKGDMKSTSFADGEIVWTNIDTPLRIYKHIWSGFIREGDNERERVHPTQKPVNLLKRILTDFTKPKDIILDLFGGSGSTLIACENLNQKCLMMELEPMYCDIIIKRFEELTGKEVELLEGGS